MKKNHLDFKDLAQSLAMDKGKLQRYATVSFLLSPARFTTAVLTYTFFFSPPRTKCSSSTGTIMPRK